jgi:predicted amidohydrolase YtcJ
MSENGVTALFEAVVDSEEVLASISELDRRQELNMFYEAAFRFRNLADLPDAIGRLKVAQAKYANNRININAMKLFLDGTNESCNSAVLAPMCGRLATEELGTIGMEAEELTECLLLCNAEGADVHIHLVGDRALRVACDAVEAAQGRLREGRGDWAIQVTLAHCELIDPADMPRPASLGIIVNWTPHWSGGYFGEQSRKNLGDARWNRMYRFNEIAQSSAVLTFGSDVVTSYELHRAGPLFGMQVASSRIDPEYPIDPQQFPKSMRPEESARLSPETLVKGYTIDGAKQLRLADKIGSIEVGKVANLVVLAESPLHAPADRLGSLACDAVIFEGRVVAGSLP